MQIYYSSCGGGERWMGKGPRVTDYLLGSHRKSSDWLIKITFLGKVETAVKSGIKSWFADVGFGTSNTILGLWFSL